MLSLFIVYLIDSLVIDLKKRSTQVGSCCLLSTMTSMSSMYLSNVMVPGGGRSMMCAVTWYMYALAKYTDIHVPMAVPLRWWKKRWFLKLMYAFSITSSSNSRKM